MSICIAGQCPFTLKICVKGSGGISMKWDQVWGGGERQGVRGGGQRVRGGGSSIDRDLLDPIWHLVWIIECP